MKIKLKLLTFSSLFIAVAFSISLFLSSCGKKTEEHNLEITMTSAPTPALKDSLITFTFTVKDMDVLTSVMDYSCEVNSSATVMTMTESSTGVYTGTQTFSTTGNHNLLFKYMHDDDSGSKPFTITIQ